jgi:hypothetical protein
VYRGQEPTTRSTCSRPSRSGRVSARDSFRVGDPAEDGSVEIPPALHPYLPESVRVLRPKP